MNRRVGIAPPQHSRRNAHAVELTAWAKSPEIQEFLIARGSDFTHPTFSY
jgi:hypothetical protein